MHVPDGFLDAPTSAATGAVAIAVVGVALVKARSELDDRTAPMAGLVAAFVFAVQMLNFPVGAGTSGHLMGGALAAILVGPWTGILCVSVVLLVQSLLFADGGITALGTNIVLMAVSTVLVGWGVFRLLQAVLPKRLSLVPGLAGVAAFVSVPVAATVFVLLYAAGGTADIPLDTLLTAMFGVHTLIGIGEGVITGLAVGAILAVRPDLVYGARPILERRELEIRTTTGLAA
ncbi:MULTISPECIES: energy-coupling factor ABC transporter permease [unclassified Nocardioides]|uniref:energy-coupling factor ABC transporter permease n=1 Tax=unclassified Nocardioides TaxID=2615069 RepID=UPI0036166100